MLAAWTRTGSRGSPKAGRDSRDLRSGKVRLALGYWAVVCVSFGAMQAAGFDMIASGAIPIVALTLPWSLIVMTMTSSASFPAGQSSTSSITSAAGMFVILAILCAGLNAIAIFGLLSALQKRRNRRTKTTLG